MDEIKLIVGLANPGNEYKNTRHNAGAWLVERFVAKHQQSLQLENKFFGYTARIMQNNQDTRCLIPTTYMNLSGKAVVALANFYQLTSQNILVIHDELDLLPGTARFKFAGSHGGHNGLKDITQKLGNSADFYRLRIGIGHPGDKNRVVSFVLNAPSENERARIDDAIDESLSCTDILLTEGLEKAMNRLHAYRSTR